MVKVLIIICMDYTKIEILITYINFPFKTYFEKLFIIKL